MCYGGGNRDMILWASDTLLIHETRDNLGIRNLLYRINILIYSTEYVNT